MEINKGLIDQTALDYDLPYETVLNVYEKYGKDNFYDELEKLLEQRKSDY